MDDEMLEEVRRAFRDCRRPQHFTNFTHCEECREHDEVLCSHDVDSITIDQLGSPGWDPICYISAEGFAYYFPAFARLALQAPDPKWGWYAPQLFFHLQNDGSSPSRWEYFTPTQREVVVRLLHHIIESRVELLDSTRDRSEEHTSELQSLRHLVCRLLLEKKK